jgi:hypothetical protein
VSFIVSGMVEVMPPLSASARKRALAGRSLNRNRTSPLNVRSRTRPPATRRPVFTVTAPMPVSSRSLPVTSAASIGPRRTSAVTLPPKRLIVSRPSSSRTLSINAA